MNVGRRSTNGYHRQIRLQTTTLPAKSGSQRPEHGSSEATSSRNGKSVQIPSSGCMESVSLCSLQTGLDMLVTDRASQLGAGKLFSGKRFEDSLSYD